MPFKPKCLILLVSSFVLALVLAGTAHAQNGSRGEHLIDECDPETIGISRIHPPESKRSPVFNESLHMSWCFTIAGAPSNISSEHTSFNSGTISVIQHIVIWETDVHGTHQINKTSIELDCEKDGFVGWNRERRLVFFNNAKVECTTVDLQAQARALSNGRLDICEGELACEIPIITVVNYINIPEHGCPTPFPVGNALFSYEEVLLGTATTPKSSRQLLFSLNETQMSVELPSQDSHNSTLGIAIEQRGSLVDFAVNDELITSEVIEDSITYFNSQPTTITFGYNPETGEYINGCFGESIFDPNTGGPSFWGG